jgi:hypothetical protein
LKRLTTNASENAEVIGLVGEHAVADGDRHLK